MKKIINLFPILFLMFFIQNCSEDNPAGSEFTQSVSKIIGADGGAVESEEGIILEIPEGAILSDTEIIMTPVSGKSFSELGIVGVKLEPDGLEFSKTALLKLPLPTDWDADELPMVYDLPGEEEEGFLPFGPLAEVIGSPGAYFCVIEVSHFSSLGAALNCHAGTFDFLVNDFESRGCSLNELRDTLNARHGSEIEIEELEATGEFNVDNIAIQKFLDVYFNDLRGFSKDEEISDAFMSDLSDYVAEGRQVVVAFARSWNKNSSGFYNGFAHTGILEDQSGTLKLRQSVSVNREIIDRLINQNGANVLWYPINGGLTARTLNNFRKLPTCVGLEEELCGTPGCLWEDRPVEMRPKPYEAVRFYVSKYSGNQNPCNAINDLDYTDCWIEITVGSTVWEHKDLLTGDVYNSYTSGNSFGGVTFSGSFSSNKFIGFIDRTREFSSGADTTKGSIMVQLNEAGDMVSSVEFNLEHWSYSSNINSRAYSYTEFSGTNIPLESLSHPNTFSVLGAEACDRVGTLEMLKSYNIPDGSTNYEETLVNFECNIGGEEMKLYFSN